MTVLLENFKLVTYCEYWKGASGEPRERRIEGEGNSLVQRRYYLELLILGLGEQRVTQSRNITDTQHSCFAFLSSRNEHNLDRRALQSGPKSKPYQIVSKTY